ncbi:hypothetical protein ACA910_020449 [Epithemia clementina (nom. ined.)]
MAKKGRRQSRSSQQRGSAGEPSDENTEQRHPVSSEFQWNAVKVSFAGEADSHDDNGDDEYNLGDASTKLLEKNHYDNPSMQKLASLELEASSDEAAGIFFGLEVLDGNSYRIQEDPNTKQKVMLPVNQTTSMRRTEPDHRSGGDSDRSKQADESTTETTRKENQSTKKTKERKRSADREGKEEGGDRQTEIESVQSKDQRNPRNKHGKTGAAVEKVSNTELKDDKEVRTKETAEGDITDDQIMSMQTSWSAQTGGVALHKILCEALIKQKFWSPTPIQAAALPAAVLGRRNIVGAAPTGSGKTLAFLLPIGQYILDNQSANSENKNVGGGVECDGSTSVKPQRLPLQALVLTPTRELALQIQTESDKLLGKGMTGTLVGGLAHAKQIRMLEKKRPPIIVATPGRLWEMMSSREYAHLNDLSQIKFLVIDEADRMIKQGSFPQLSTILDAVQRANPEDEDDDDGDNVSETQDEDDANHDRLLGLPGVPGEAKLVMLDDHVLAEIERVKATEQGGSAGDEAKELDSAELDDQEDENQGIVDVQADDELSLPALPPVYRQTFVYSATLTLPASANFTKSKKARFAPDVHVDGAIAEILEKARAKGKTKVIDLSNVNKTKKMSKEQRQQVAEVANRNVAPVVNEAETFRLPEGLFLQEIKCTQRHKDSHLYAYLMTTVEGSSGPCLVFCNSIACVRRVGSTLQALGMDARILHAQMQQRARFKAVELLQESKRRTVVVATDVAARGLDIPSVASVVHYDAARTVDAFVHRSGRTARGVGPNAVGCSVSMVAPDEDKMHSAISKSLGVRFEPVMIDGRLLQGAQERVNLASKIAEVGNLEGRSQRQNQWLKGKAADAGIDIDEDILDEGLSGGDLRDRAKLKEAQRAREKLAQLLLEPLKPQRYGKFLSTNSSLKQEVMLQNPKVLYNAATGRRRKRRRR